MLRISVILLLFALPGYAHQLPDTIPGDYINRPEVKAFIKKLVAEQGFERDFLEALFYPVRQNEKILAKVNAPAEGISWQRYRNIFITPERIRAGVAFWQQHDSLINTISRQYGIAPEYLVAIAGVETYYGRHTGSYPVLQSLTTLAFDFPKRGRFYKKELVEFLLLCREERLSPLKLHGSYAGAMGIPQFIASSYRFYAVDQDGDKVRNLWQVADALGSIANYFKQHGWQSGMPVAIKAQTTGGGHLSMADTVARKPRYTLAQLQAAGVRPQGEFKADKVVLVQMNGKTTPEYWIGSHNFYVITRYNHSPKYALAVHQLAQAIRAKRTTP